MSPKSGLIRTQFSLADCSCPNEPFFRTLLSFYHLFLSNSSLHSDSALLLSPVPVRFNSSFGLGSPSITYSCPIHRSIRTLLSFYHLFLSDSTLHSDSVPLLSPVLVRINSSFGLGSPTITYSCPIQLFIRTLLSFYHLFLSESPLHSDSALLLSPVPVRITTPFGLCSPSITCSCPNHHSIRTLLSFYHLFLSDSTLHSDSALLLSPVPVRITTPFGLCSPSITYSCPNHHSIRTLLSFYHLFLSESPLHSDSALLLSPILVRFIAQFGLYSPSITYSCPIQLFIQTRFWFYRLFLSDSTLHSDSVLVLSPILVRFNSSFGLCSPSITCSCPIQLFIRTLLPYYHLFLSKSPLHSDSALLLSPIPVRITTPFGLCSPTITYSCPNHRSIRTLFSFYHLFLSDSTLHSDSALLLSPIPVRFTTPFGLCSPSITYSCPNHHSIRTLLPYYHLFLSDSPLHSDSALLLSPILVRFIAQFGLYSPSITYSCPIQLFIQTRFWFYRLFLSDSTLHSDSALLLSPIPVRFIAPFGPCSPSITCSCPIQLFIQTPLSFYHLFLSKSTPHSDSVLVLLPTPVRIITPFGLCYTSITYSCPNQLFIRTLLPYYHLFLSESTLH